VYIEHIMQGDKPMEQFEIRGWVALYRRYESVGFYTSIDDAINSGIEKFKFNGTSFDVFEGTNKVVSVIYHRGVVTSRIPEWIPTVHRF
jgi:hypothetical protein